MAKVDRALALAGLKEIERRSAPPRAGMARRLTHLALRLSELGNAMAFAARRGALRPRRSRRDAARGGGHSELERQALAWPPPVIPKWILSLVSGASVQVNGDGLTIRDFSSVKDVVQADQRVALLQSAVAGQVFNIGSGQRTTLLILLAELPNCAARCARRSGPCNAASG